MDCPSGRVCHRGRVCGIYQSYWNCAKTFRHHENCFPYSIIRNKSGAGSDMHECDFVVFGRSVMASSHGIHDYYKCRRLVYRNLCGLFGWSTGRSHQYRSHFVEKDKAAKRISLFYQSGSHRKMCREFSSILHFSRID